MSERTCCTFGSGLILQAVASAIRPGRLLVAVFCLALLVGGGTIWDAIAGPISEDLPAPFDVASQQVEGALGAVRYGVLHLDPGAVTDGIFMLTWGTPASLWAMGAHWFLFIYGLYALAILALSLGIQSRFEAIVVAERQPPSTDRLLDDFGTLSGGFIGAWITPVTIVAFFALLILAGSFVLLNIPVLNIVGAVLWGMVLLLAVALAVALLGLCVCGALLVPSVAVDGCAGPDAMHRAFTTATSRPLRWLWYVTVISIGLGLGLLVVDTVASLAAWLATGLGGVWVFNDAFAVATFMNESGLNQFQITSMSNDTLFRSVPDASWTTIATGEILKFWLVLLRWLVAGWVLCYLAAASTRAWMLMRVAIDGTAIEDIWRPGLMRGTLAPEHRD